ncbi:MAG: hypothetical protein QNI86_10645 [Halieaceae bacterium]|nr:hypothetical protein [Halieaceae bacterium]
MADSDKLSTSALARKLGLPVQQLFATLKDYGWIQRHQDSWLLTNKGEFEGGGYVDSQRYGRYIVWPDTLVEHPMLSAIESNQRVSASGLRRYYPKLHPRQINRALGELGLQVHSVLGWELTEQGRKLGGQQEESDNSGAYYVTWPHEIVDHPVIHRELDAQSDAGSPAPAEPADDLFASAALTELVGIDGHALETALELKVCNWLYLAQLAHAHQRALPVEEVLYADFYLPAARVYIECWDEEVPPERLGLKLKKKDVYREAGLRLIEINEKDADRLDEVLGRPLMDFGIRV